ncbi:hypothetical protein VM636_27800 [Streptomyces sp. SCSIO 75703]|uniref:Uncharacterized protein n=1 Tax=Streptomyces sp. T676 TaxID=1691390 RepID=A0A0M1QF99_9ACTN|nr:MULTISPECIES: hypothetical protein [unclassified Streptomyces]CTQ34886.1 AtcI; hypothetical protein, 6 transmembrane helices [Streptomyces sp. T676]
MRTARVIWANDLRSVVRDRTVGGLLVVPLVFLVLLRAGVPLLERRWPAVGGHHAELLGLFCVIVGMFPAFMTALLMVDERDQGLVSAFRVLPLSPARFLGARLAMAGLLGLLYPLLLLSASGLGGYGAGRALVLAALCAAGGAAALLVAVSLAKNKIECLTAFKALFVLAAIGVTGALGDFSGVNALPGVLPAYWVFGAFAAGGTGAFLSASAVAALLYGIVVGIFHRLFRRNFF